MQVTMVLTNRGAQYHDAIRAMVREALTEVGLAGLEVQETIIRDDEEALAAQCIGSPTIRVNDLDIEYMEREPDERSAGVRYFNTAGGWKPVPEKGMLVRALRQAIERVRGR